MAHNWFSFFLKITTYYNILHLELFPKVVEGSLEVKLPTIWTDEKQRREESERREE